MKLNYTSKKHRWTVGPELGKGGNAVVSRAENEHGDVGALKRLISSRLQDMHKDARARKGVDRFLREIQFLKANSHRRGVLPLVDAHLPAEPSVDDPPWFVSPIATPLDRAFASDNRDFLAVVETIATIAETLAGLHEQSIYHRDIKPGNLLLREAEPLVGDFGLVDLPDLETLTDRGEIVGPAFFIAPEMMHDAVATNAGPADVYSLAKTLWVLGTGQRYPLPGEQRIDVPALTLSAYVRNDRAVFLDPLLAHATATDPTCRPSMSAFARNLREWLKAPAMMNEPADLSHLKSRLEAVLEPSKRMLIRREEYGRLSTEIFHVLVGYLLKARTLMADVAPVSDLRDDDTVIEEILNSWSNRQRRGPWEFTRGAGMTLADLGSIVPQYEKTIPAIYLLSGVGVEISTKTDEIYIAAGHFTGIGTSFKQPVWYDQAVFIKDTADHDNAMRRIGGGLVENAGRALEKFADQVASFRRIGQLCGDSDE